MIEPRTTPYGHGREAGPAAAVGTTPYASPQQVGTSAWMGPASLGTQIKDWTPEMGHIPGGAFERAYANRQPLLADKPLWTRVPTLPFPKWAGGQASTFQSPGFPVRISPETLLNDPTQQDFWLKGPGAVAMGGVPGQQRGGAMDFFGFPLATTPLTIENAATYFAEAPLAVISSIYGHAAQELPDGTVASDIEDVPIIGSVISGLRMFGDTAAPILDGAMSTKRRVEATTRIEGFAELVATGQTDRSLINGMTTIMGLDQGDAEAIRIEAEKRGVDWVALAAELWDIPVDVKNAILQDPRKYYGGTVRAATGMAPFGLLGEAVGTAMDVAMGNSAAWELANGVPYSLDPGVNNLAEIGSGIGMTIAAIAASGGLAGILRGGATTSAFVPGWGAAPATAGRLAAGAARLGRGMAPMGRFGRDMARVYNINNAAGLALRGTEWGMKQLAVLGGNEELVKTMDEWLWERPLSTNFGLNAVASVFSRPLGTARSLSRGRIPIGDPKSVGAIGELNFRRRGITTFENPNAYVFVSGRPLAIRPPAQRAIGILRAADIPTMHANWFGRLGFRLERLTATFGENNPFGFTSDDLRDMLLHIYLFAAREDAGRALDMIPGATQAERNVEFMRQYSPEVKRMIDSDLAGETDFFRRTMETQFWLEAGTRSDSAWRELGQMLGPFDAEVALDQITSWVRASKTQSAALTTRAERLQNVPRKGRELNLPWIAEWRASFLSKYAPDQKVTIRDINRLKVGAGPSLEIYGAGGRMFRLTRGQWDYTRTEVEGFLDDIVSSYEAFVEGQRSTRIFDPTETAEMVARGRPATGGIGAREHGHGRPVRDRHRAGDRGVPDVGAPAQRHP